MLKNFDEGAYIEANWRRHIACNVVNKMHETGTSYRQLARLMGSSKSQVRCY